MHLFTIAVKKYKSIFCQTQIINVVGIIAAFVLVKNGFFILSTFDTGRKLTLPILAGVVFLGFIHSQYQRNQLTKIQSIPDFEGRLERYERFYNIRMIWFLFSCLTSCFLTILSSRYLFLLYASFDVLTSFRFFPRLPMFKRELENDEIILY